jgi:LysR family transcriptional regulator, nitrogen assimilation regulatory protein
MDLKQLEYFVRVAELGSFTRASQLLKVAQPALSRQVRALEVELRQNLFARNGRGVTLTEAGRLLLGHGRGILQQVQRARQELDEQRGVAAGALSIGLPPSLSRTHTAPLVEAFRARFPKATLTVVEGLSNYMLEWLQQGRIDCAVVYNAAPAPDVELVPVAEERLHLVAARGKARAPIGAPATLADVAAAELVIPSRPHAIRMRIEGALAEAGLKARVGLEIESVPAILDLVQRHPLAAVLSLSAIRASGQAEAFCARPLLAAPGRPLVTTLWLATSSQRPRGPLLDQAGALVVELLRSTLNEAASARSAGSRRAASPPAGAPTKARRARPRGPARSGG